MINKIKLLLLSVIIPLLFLAVATTPVQIFGCRNRGLLAFTLALISLLFALVSTIKGAKNRVKDKSNYLIWLICTVILALPAIYILILASRY